MAGTNGHHAPSEYPPPVDSVKEFVKRELDDQDERIDVGVAIVGGGITGMVAAYLLTEAGVSVALVEALRIGQGSTGHSTGNLYSIVGERHHKLGDEADLPSIGALGFDRFRLELGLGAFVAIRLKFPDGNWGSRNRDEFRVVEDASAAIDP